MIRYGRMMHSMAQSELQFLGHCPVCSRKYAAQEAEVLRRSETMLVVHVECTDCGSTVLAAIVTGVMGIVTTIGMLTDLSRQDIDRFWNARVLTSDDVLKAHTYLEGRARKHRAT